MEKQTIVADVADQLALRLVSGEYTAGDLMPSVRQVADEFEMNRATAQLVLVRLESLGFVDARWGKGFTIRDVRLTGGVDVYRHLFRLSKDLPEVAADTFRDILEVERSILADVLSAYSRGEHAIDVDVMSNSVDHLEALATASTPDLREFLTAEIAMVRDLLSAAGNTFHLAIFNSIGEMVLEIPEATEAFFAAAPDIHVLVWRTLEGIWGRDAEPSDAELGLFHDLFTIYHNRVIGRFEELVGATTEAAQSDVGTAAADTA